jgi:hypothetical protein
MLHAWKLAFEHPLKRKRMEFKAKVPDEFKPWMAGGMGE